MKAAVLYEYNSPLVVEEVDLDGPKADEVLVRIAAAGICRSDYHFMKGEATTTLPTVLGHEGAGIVEQVGQGVTRVKPGDPVILSFVRTVAFATSAVRTAQLVRPPRRHSRDDVRWHYQAAQGRSAYHPLRKSGLFRDPHGGAGIGVYPSARGVAPGSRGPYRVLRHHRRGRRHP